MPKVEVTVTEIGRHECLQLSGLMSYPFTVTCDHLMEAAQQDLPLSIERLKAMAERSQIPADNLSTFQLMIVHAAVALEVRHSMHAGDLPLGDQCDVTIDALHCTLKADHPGIEHVAHAGYQGRVLYRWVAV